MRAFVIGNGPSLRDTPLDRLVGEVTFAMNRINLLYDKTEWRPAYYLALDWTGPQMLEDTLENIGAAKHSFVRADRANDIELRRSELDWPPRVSYFWPCRRHAGMNFESNRRPSDWHLPCVCAYGSTLGAAIQLAVLMGYGPLYLLGCDLGFTPIGDGPDTNHFHPAYMGHDDFSLGTRDATLRHMHSLAEKSSPVKIYNASMGGILEEHERVDLEDIPWQ